MVAELVEVASEGLHIALDKIRDDLSNVRRDWGHADGQQKLDGLRESIQQYGILQPIEVSPRGDGLYDVLVGHRRFDAARQLGLPTIPAVVRDTTGKERIFLQLVENIQRQDLSFTDKARTLQGLVDEYGYSCRAVDHALNAPRGMTAKALKVFGDPVLRRAVQHGLMGEVTAGELHGLHEDYSRPLYDMLRAGQPVTRSMILDARRRQHSNGLIKDAHGQRRGHSERTWGRIEEAIRLRDEEGLTRPQIAERMGVSLTIVKRFMAIHRHASPEPMDYGSLCVAAVEMYQQGISITNICMKLSADRGTINRILENASNDDKTGLRFEVDPQTYTVVRTIPPRHVNDLAVRSPLPLKTDDEESSVALSPIAEIKLRDLIAPLPSAPFERVLMWAAKRGMSVDDLLQAYRAECR